MRARIAGVLVALGFLTLVSNRVPAVPVSCFLLASLLVIGRPGPIGWRLAAVWGFWLVSFLLTRESLSVLFSPAFHRRDGQIFFSMAPLLVASWASPPAGPAKKVLMAFCVLQAIVAFASSAVDLLGRRDLLLGVTFLFDEGGSVANYCGLYQAHNAAGSVQALCVLICASMAAFGSGARVRWTWGLLVAPLLWGVILSKSRGALLAMFIGLIVLGEMALRNRLLSRRALLGIAVVVVATASLYSARVVRRLGQFGDSAGTHRSRWEWWKRGLQEWMWSPLLGEGLGRYNDHGREWSGVKHLYYVVTRAEVVNAPTHAHNSYIHFLAEGGIVGLGLTVGLWTWLGWRFRRPRAPIRVAAFLGIAYLFPISMTEHYMGGGAMLLVLTSLVGAAWNQTDEPPFSPEGLQSGSTPVVV